MHATSGKHAVHRTAYIQAHMGVVAHKQVHASAHRGATAEGC